MTTLKSIASLALDLAPSCIQFCPRIPRLFVIGTYYLHRNEQQGDLPTDNTADNIPSDDDETTEEATEPANHEVQKRTGSLILYQLNHDKITHISTLATDFAILDIQWTRHPEKLGDLLAVATSTGLLAFYRLDILADGSPQLVLSCVKTITHSSTLVLSLTWHPFRPHVLGLTLSNGSVCLCESTEGPLWSQDAVLCMSGIQKHELEAWIMAFTPESTNVLSGGDDIVLQCSHINEVQSRSVLWQDRKLHDAGVTSILPLSDTLVLTGSYDDHIRLLSLPAVGRRQVLAEANLGGGVWRMQMLSSSSTKRRGHEAATLGADAEEDSSDSALPEISSHVLLACCMHAGTRIVRIIQDANRNWSFEVLGKFEEHQSMNYGSDVQPARAADGNGSGTVKTIVSTSFYDKLLCLWRVDLSSDDVVVPSSY